MVLPDVERGLVTDEGARRYGVVITDGKVDAARDRQAARRDGAQARQDRSLFDRGFTSKELKARCKAETGL